jgi:integrase
MTTRDYSSRVISLHPTSLKCFARSLASFSSSRFRLAKMSSIPSCVRRRFRFCSRIASNRHPLSIAVKTIQRILRHANVAVTQACYIKTADSEISAAMQRFERSLEYVPDMHLSGAQRQRLM